MRFRGSNLVAGKNKKPLISQGLLKGVPTGIRTPVAAVKGQCPRPLDDGDKKFFVSRLGLEPRTPALKGRCSTN